MVCSRDYEAAAVHDAVEDRDLVPLTPGGSISRAVVEGLDVWVTVSDVGPVASALSTASALSLATSFRAVLSIGIAGAFAPTGLALGDLVIADEIHHGDFGVDDGDDLTPARQLDWPDGSFECDPALVAALGDALGCAVGPIVTVTRQSSSATRAAAVCRTWPSALAEAMEGVGVAAAARRFGIPFIEIRAISNIVGSRIDHPWDKPAALQSIAGATERWAAAIRDLSRGRPR